MLIEYFIETLKDNNLDNSKFTEFILEIERDYTNGDLENTIEKIYDYSSRDKKTDYNKSRLFLLSCAFYSKIGLIEDAHDTYEAISFATEFIKSEYQKFQIEYFVAGLETSLDGINEDNASLLLTEINLKIMSINNQLDEPNYLKILLNYFKSSILQKAGKFEEGVSLLNDSLMKIHCLKEPKSDFEKNCRYYYLTNLGFLYFMENKFELALNKLFECLKLVKEINNKSNIYRALNNLGVVYVTKGELNQAEKYFTETIEELKTQGNKTILAIALLNIAMNYHSKGLLDQALGYSEQSYQYFEDNKKKKEIAYCLGLIASIYVTKGLLDKALNYGRKSLNNYQDIGEQDQKGEILRTLSRIYKAKNNIDKSIEYCEQSLTLARGLRNKTSKVKSLFTAIDLYLVKKDLIKAKDMMAQLETIALESNNSQDSWIQLIYHFSKALVLKNSPRLKSKALAQDEFNYIIEKQIIDFDIYSSALINIIELLIDEFIIYNEPEVLEEIKERINILHQEAIEQGAYGLLTNSYLLQARLSLIYGELIKSELLIDEAVKTAKEHGLTSLYEKCIKTRENLTKELNNWEKLVSQNAPLKERFQKSELKDYIDEANNLVNQW